MMMVNRPHREPINKLVLNWLKEWQNDREIRADLSFTNCAIKSSQVMTTLQQQQLPSPPLIVDDKKQLCLLQDAKEYKLMGKFN